ncbi:hypothetical protein GCM10020331_095630 [Ectobacillus funiculus]
METKTAIAYIVPIGDIFIHAIKNDRYADCNSCTGCCGSECRRYEKKLGKLGGKTILYFEIVTTIALGLGLLAANLFHPGSGVDTTHLAKGDISAYEQTATATQKNGFAETIVHIVPKKRL